MPCHRENLPERWYRQERYLRDELAAHGTCAAAARAHDVLPGTVAKAWSSVVGEPLPRGPKAATHVVNEEQVSREEVLEAEVKELRRHAGRSRATDVATERLLQRLEQAIPETRSRYKPLPARRGGKLSEHEFVLLFSDTHASEVVRADETLGMNAYDWETMLARMRRLQEAVLSYQAHRPYPIRRLHVWMLGDMLSGDIHDELAITNDRPTAEAAVQFAYDATAWLEQFVPHFERVSVAGVPGNHPRTTRKPAAKQAHNNADWLSYQMMRMLTRAQPALEWNVRRGSYTLATVCERFRCLLMHGDGIRTTMPGVPWGGVVRRITTLEQQFAKAGEPLDYVALGHFHTANSLDGVGCKTILNGSVKGLDEYSLKSFGSGRPASQVLLTFHPRHGLTDVSTIDLQLPALAEAA